MIYRTDGAWGTGKGGNLTPAEVDGNFYELDQRVESLEENPPAPAEIDTIALVGTQLTITLTDARVFGPFTLPRATFRYRGDFVGLTAYFANDFISVPGDGIYMVLVNHTSEASFDADREISSEAVYLLLYQEPRSQVVAVAGATFDPDLSHVWAYCRCAGTCEVFIPTNADMAFPVGTEIHFRQLVGAVSFTPEVGVTLNVPDGFLGETAQAGAVATIKKVATNEWDVFGWLAADVGP